MSIITSTQIAAIANKYEAFLTAGMSYGDALSQAAAALGGTPCPTLLEALAKVHAKKYHCNYTWNATGSAVFYEGDESTRETRQEAATKSWQRNVMVWFKPAVERARAEPTKQRVTAEERAAFKVFLAACGGDKKRAAAVFKALNA
jgi:hypothetical protein